MTFQQTTQENKTHQKPLTNYFFFFSDEVMIFNVQ